MLNDAFVLPFILNEACILTSFTSRILKSRFNLLKVIKLCFLKISHVVGIILFMNKLARVFRKEKTTKLHSLI